MSVTVYPTPEPYVTSSYGWRVLGGVSNFHSGTDYRAPTGTELYAVADGVVANTGKNHPRAGNWVEILLDTGEIAGYSHLSRVDVPKGKRVRAGEIIGLAGATGNVTAAHLHFYLSRWGTMIDPHAWLRGKKATTIDYKPSSPSGPSDKEDDMRRYSMRTTGQNLTKGRWNTIQVTDLGGVSTAFGPCEYDSIVTIHFKAPTGTQVRGRFYKMNYRTGQRGYTYDVESKVDSPETQGNTMCFSTAFAGELGKDERLRFEVYTWDDNVVVTSAAYRTKEE